MGTTWMNVQPEVIPWKPIISFEKKNSLVLTQDFTNELSQWVVPRDQLHEFQGGVLAKKVILHPGEWASRTYLCHQSLIYMDSFVHYRMNRLWDTLWLETQFPCQAELFIIDFLD